MPVGGCTLDIAASPVVADALAVLAELEALSGPTLEELHCVSPYDRPSFCCLHGCACSRSCVKYGVLRAFVVYREDHTFSDHGRKVPAGVLGTSLHCVLVLFAHVD
jgi:hypothetical protein